MGSFMRSIVLSFLIAAALFHHTPDTKADPPSFTGLGELVGEEISGIPTGVSGDGSVIVGPNGKTAAFRWSANTGLIDLDMGSGQNLLQMVFEGFSPRVSQDGFTVVGSRILDFEVEASRWTESGGVVVLNDLPALHFQSRARDVSADGAVIVGYAESNLGAQAFRWTEGEGLVPLGDLSGGSINSVATAVSADGSTIAGNGESASGPEAFRWTEATGMVGLGALDAINHYSQAHNISADGNVIVGVSSSGGGYQPFRWTEESGMVGLGTISDSGTMFEAYFGSYAVSGDGSTIVGSWFVDDQGAQAFLWAETHGMRGLKDVLVSDYGLDLLGWELSSAIDISDDGRTIVGYGLSPGGGIQGWVAVVPEPSSIVLAGVGLGQGAAGVCARPQQR